jgi:hypothetical protein
MTVSPVAPDSGPRLAPSPTHRNSATGEPASRVAAVPTTDTPVLARSADVARELGEAGHAASSYELAQPFAEAGDMAIARAEQAGAHFVTRAAPVQAEQEAAHPVTPIARVQAVQTGTDPAARIAQVQRAFTPPASSALRTAVARDARRLPRPLLSGYGLPGRGADMDARRTDRDSAGPSLWVDRLADQYGVVPIDTQKTAARPAGAPPPAQSTSAPPAQTPADAMELAEKAWQIIQDKLAVERERRGYAPWP